MIRINKKYTGVIIPMVTPFTGKYQVDTEAVEKILHSFMNAKAAPFLLGTTGESISLSKQQQTLLVQATVRFINKKAIVYAGISGNCLDETIESAKIFADIGADIVVAHLPFYYPLNAEQMLRYYEQIADNVPCPLILYNNPITTKYSVPLEVIEKLSHHPNIAGIKDSERGMDRLDASLKLWSNRTDFVHLTGWAAQSAYGMLNGSDGIIPSTGNVVPELYAQLYNAAIKGDITNATQLQDKANEISEIYQKDRNLSESIPALKVMMNAIGLCNPTILPPMYDLSEDEQIKIKNQVARTFKEFNNPISNK